MVLQTDNFTKSKVAELVYQGNLYIAYSCEDQQVVKSLRNKRASGSTTRDPDVKLEKRAQGANKDGGVW